MKNRENSSNNHNEDSGISSSEMTAYWRSAYPKLSQDDLSQKLASANGILKAHQFEEKYNYPLISRKISIRARWCYEQAVEIISTKKYDACISLGSGFSLLTYLIARSILNNEDIDFIDVDLNNILYERKVRIQDLLNKRALNEDIIKNLKTLAINLEESYQKGEKFERLFGNVSSPVFILEGIIYFLSRDCVRWIFNGISTFRNHAVIFDYWPDDSLQKSDCFRRMFGSLNDFIPEQIQGLLDENELNCLSKNSAVKDISLQEVENTVSLMHRELPQLTNVNEFIPVRLRVIQSI